MVVRTVFDWESSRWNHEYQLNCISSSPICSFTSLESLPASPGSSLSATANANPSMASSPSGIRSGSHLQSDDGYGEV